MSDPLDAAVDSLIEMDVTTFEPTARRIALAVLKAVGPPRLVGVNAAAQMAGVTAHGIYKAHKRGVMPDPVPVPGTTYLVWLEEDIKRWVKERAGDWVETERLGDVVTVSRIQAPEEKHRCAYCGGGEFSPSCGSRSHYGPKSEAEG